VISARGVAKANALSIVIEDENEWRKVETFIERWMKEGKREIVVKLTGTWRKKKGNILLDDDDEQCVGKPNKATVCHAISLCRTISLC
jgi:major membrane immunogen (membrane-anchored lipoprotein)